MTYTLTSVELDAGGTLMPVPATSSWGLAALIGLLLLSALLLRRRA